MSGPCPEYEDTGRKTSWLCVWCFYSYSVFSTCVVFLALCSVAQWTSFAIAEWTKTCSAFIYLLFISHFVLDGMAFHMFAQGFIEAAQVNQL